MSTEADPRATYRLQLHPGFAFADAVEIAGYLAGLGVSHLYLSPVLQAAPGSTHGYDVVDPTRVSADLGGEEGFAALAAAASDAGLGLIVDVVPNHMAIGPGNAWWWDVLENGPSSVYASYFDVDWEPPESKLRDRVLLPILGDRYGLELEAGRITLERRGGSFHIVYYDQRAPLAPRSLDTLLGDAAATLPAGVARNELESIATAFGRLPAANRVDPEGVHERHRDKEVLRARLERICAEHREAAAAVDRSVAAVNADHDALDSLLARQNYRLAWWRTAAEELDYRRFFDINDLVGLRVEDPVVFAHSHGLILGWLAGGVIDGLRIDHVDGLLDPAAYLSRLGDAAPGSWTVVEKILGAGEELPGEWPVAGTTGYDWLSTAGRILVDASGYEGILAGYRAFTGHDEDYGEVVHASKLAVLDGPLSADLNRLVNRVAAICEEHRRYRDFTRRDLREALRELLAGYRVYRTYVTEHTSASGPDREVIVETLAAATSRRPDINDELLGFLARMLAGEVAGAAEREVALRAQQLTGAVTAKAVEDTAFYRYLPLVSANEVGADPSRPASAVEDYHASCQRRHAGHPRSLLALSTHDTKRAEDVRARLAVLCEIPEEWNAAVERWSAIARRSCSDLVDRRTQWLAYQTAVGAWPIDAERLSAYLAKATKEAKVRTSWTDPDPDYDQAVQDLAAVLVRDEDLVAGIEHFVRRVRRPGFVNSLTQKLLTMTGPGIPDLYQGSECWDLSLVDPDNRRPVDYVLRRELLERALHCDAAAAWQAESGEGLSKICVVRASLALRASLPECFAPGPAGNYEPLYAEGPAAAHLVGARRGAAVIALGTRLPLGLERRGGWAGTALRLPPGRWRDHLGGGEWEGETALGDVLAGLPVALLSLTDRGPG